MLIGVALLGLLLYHAGLEQVWHRLRLLGWSAPLIFVPYAFIALFDTEAWRVTLRPEDRRRVSFYDLYMTRMAGEAVNGMTPTATIGGEPVKAFVLRRWGVPTSDGMASVVIARTSLTAAQAMFTAIGLAAILDHFGRRYLAVAWLSALLVGCVAFTAGLVWVQQRNPATVLWRGLKRIAPTWQVLLRFEPHAAALDGRLAHFYRGEKAAFVRATAWSLGGWMFGVVEVYLMAALIDAPVSWRMALIIEALSQPIRAVSIVIPSGIGAQELGGAALCTYLGMPEAAGVTLWLLKRARETAFDAVGLLYLTRSTIHRALRGT